MLFLQKANKKRFLSWINTGLLKSLSSVYALNAWRSLARRQATCAVRDVVSLALLRCYENWSCFNSSGSKTADFRLGKTRWTNPSRWQTTQPIIINLHLSSHKTGLNRSQTDFLLNFFQNVSTLPGACQCWQLAQEQPIGCQNTFKKPEQKPVWCPHDPDDWEFEQATFPLFLHPLRNYFLTKCKLINLINVI